MMPFLILCALVSGATAGAQGPAPRYLSGSWILDTYLSDHPEQIAQALRYDTGESGQDGTERGRAGGFGTGRGRVGGSGRSERERTPSKDQVNPEDRKKLKELTDAIQFAPTMLTISQTDASVSIASAARGTQTLHANGKAERYELSSGTLDRTATWDGPELIVTYEIGRAGTLRYTYALVPATRQLLIRITFERRAGQAGPFEIKLVYDPAPSGGRT